MQQNTLSGRAPPEPTDGSSAYALLQTPQLQWGLLQGGGGEGRKGKREGTKAGWEFPSRKVQFLLFFLSPLTFSKEVWEAVVQATVTRDKMTAWCCKSGRTKYTWSA